jgi:hypothetical protein
VVGSGEPGGSAFSSRSANFEHAAVLSMQALDRSAGAVAFLER